MFVTVQVRVSDAFAELTASAKLIIKTELLRVDFQEVTLVFGGAVDYKIKSSKSVYL